MKQYLDLLSHVRFHGSDKGDRTGTGTVSVFGYQMRFDLTKGFPLLTTKKMFLKGIVHELLFFLSGETNRRVLSDNGVHIWDDWGDDQGNLGPMYSHQWRNFGGRHKNRVQPKPVIIGDVSGVGSQEGYVKGSDSIGDALLIIWRGMLARCYNPSNDNYSYYGGRGVHAANRWLRFVDFMEDAQTLDGWELKLANPNDYHLDKDVEGDGFLYSIDTCSWISRSENMRAAKNRIIYTLSHDDGRKEQTQYPKDFYLRHQIAQGNFCSMLRGERDKAGGWSLISSRDIDAGIDQIANVIEQIKTNPNSRRLIVSAWNPAEVDQMALPPCHCLFQFYVADGRLSCQLYQRSGDVFLGIPFNIASYALLTHMMAQATGLQVGEFVHTIGDAHLYKNHLNQADEQLGREPRNLPKLKLNPEIKDIFDFKYEDIMIEGYDPHPSIKAPVAV